jgi:quercetin dioxygenase-like cupin family protein
MADKSEATKGIRIDLKNAVDYAAGSIVSKTLIDKKTGTLTLFAFDEGQGLSEHTAPFDAVVQILDGEAKLVVGDKEIRAAEGSLVIMPAHIPHEVRAMKKFKMLLIMIRS